MRQTLTVLVALGIIALFVLVAVEAPPSSPPVVVGSLPLRVGSFTLPNVGTYYAPCGAGSLPIWWAVFVYPSDRSNATFHLSGAWSASRPTYVSFGFSGNVTDWEDLGGWILFAHCPVNGSPSPPTAPVPPSLPRSGSVDYNMTTLPSATLFILVVRSFDRNDRVEVTQPFTVSPV